MHMNESILNVQRKVVDVAEWFIDQGDFSIEGSRVKTYLLSPETIMSNSFLRPSRHYLFKSSHRRYEDEFWVEILAYHLGVAMGIAVPPAFAAYNSKTEKSGALIEWFLEKIPGSIEREKSWSGSDLCKKVVDNFDTKKGIQHSFQIIEIIFKAFLEVERNSGLKNWVEEWAKVLLFDALIGNTDRHQENWQIIYNYNPVNAFICELEKKSNQPTSISDTDIRYHSMELAFDNGSSMGREYLPNKILSWSNEEMMQYIEKGTHHMTWKLNNMRTDPKKGEGHLTLLQRLNEKYPETREIMINCLKKVNPSIFSEILNNLTKLTEPPVKFITLNTERAESMLKLLEKRYERLIKNL